MFFFPILSWPEYVPPFIHTRNKLTKQPHQYALTHFYGIGRATSHRVCARMQIHDRCRVRDLTPTQITSLTAFLSSPSTSPDIPHFHTASPSFIPPKPNKSTLPIALPRQTKLTNRMLKHDSVSDSTTTAAGGRPVKSGTTTQSNNGSKSSNGDPLKNLKIESDLKREVRENIAHQRMIGSYVGRRHAMGLPVRGQNTQTNAKTARKLNRVERYS